MVLNLAIVFRDKLFSFGTVGIGIVLCLLAPKVSHCKVKSPPHRSYRGRKEPHGLFAVFLRAGYTCLKDCIFVSFLVSLGGKL